MAINLSFEVVIGSWGSYNACNERALGSEWIDFKDYDSWEEIEEELNKQGFVLEGIDEELFIQDYDDELGFNADHMHPQRLFNILYEADIDTDHEWKKMKAFIEVNSWEDFVNLVEEKGSNWGDEIYLYEDRDMEEVAEEMFWSCGYLSQIPEHLHQFIDYKAYGEWLEDGGNFNETKYGILEVWY